MTKGQIIYMSVCGTWMGLYIIGQMTKNFWYGVGTLIGAVIVFYISYRGFKKRNEKKKIEQKEVTKDIDDVDDFNDN